MTACGPLEPHRARASERTHCHFMPRCADSAIIGAPYRVRLIDHDRQSDHMPTKPKRKSGTAATSEREADVFLAALKRHGQVRKADGPLKPGVTHVLEPAKPKGKSRLVRKRFSAI
jgi:hypothetical protein